MSTAVIHVTSNLMPMKSMGEGKDPTIVSIDESGTIRGLAEGVAEITATVGELNRSFKVMIK